MTKKGYAVTVIAFNSAGLAVTMPLWIMGIMSTRALVGITLALSWLAPILEGVNSLFIAEESE